MTTFKFVTINENLGTRQLGEYVRTLLLRLIEENEKVVLDFTGVNVVSNSFADECLAKLLFTMPLEELKQRTTFRFSPTVECYELRCVLKLRYHFQKNTYILAL